MNAIQLAARLSADLGVPVLTADIPHVVAGLNRAFTQGVVAAQQQPLWGFFWSDCVYEVPPVLQSLHRSKRSALRAMIRAQADRWEASRDNATPSMCRSGRKQFDYRSARRMESYSISAVAVLP